MRVRLQVGVASTFTFITVAMIGATVAFLYFSNRNLAIETAQAEMTEARNVLVSEIMNVIVQTGRVVKTTAKLIAAFPDGARSFDGMEVLYSQIEAAEQYYGLYFGLEEDGAFYQIVKLPQGLDTFGPRNDPVPVGTKIVLREIQGSPGEMTDRYVYQSAWGKITGSETGQVDYDPRTRPWYKAAAARDGVFVTRLYRFQSTGRPGVTFAHRVVDRDGKLIGVVGADLTMSKLAEILSEIRIGEEGQVFMLDRDGRLITYTGTRQGGEGVSFAGAGPQEQVLVENPVIASAIATWIEEQTEFFEFSAQGDGRTYLGSAAPIPEIFGVYPTLGFTVPEDEFVGAIKKSTTRVLEISAVILLIAIAVTILVARFLSRHLQLVAEEAERISHFDLSGDFNLRSSIQEVAELSSAISSMKVGLGSFGAYVPTDLVRTIISSGEAVSVGGTSRELTILFSDLEGFTAKTESLDPETLMPALSRYFEAMEKKIAANHGTVDKYIGDAIMALWNAPLDDPDHAAHACRALLACQAAEAELNLDSDKSQLLPVRTRFGLHCGRVVVGNVGSLSRMQYTALGATVNLASRVEGLNKAYGTRALVTETVVEKVGDAFVFREVDLVSPAGTTKPIAIFEPIGETDARSAFPVGEDRRKELAAWRACYQLYRAQKWHDALAAFEAHRAGASTPALVETYLQRCRTFVDAPPGEAWDGVYQFSTK